MPGVVLGLDIGFRAVTASRIKGAVKGPELLGSAYALEEGGIVSALKSISGLIDLSCDTSVVCICPSRFSYRNISLPFSRRTTIKRTLGFELEAVAYMPEEDFVFDFCAYGKEEDRTRLLAALMPRGEFAALLDTLKSVGVDPDLVTIGWLPVLKWLLRRPGTPGQGLLLELGSERTVIYGFVNRRPFLIRHIGEGPEAPWSKGSNCEVDNVFLKFLVKALSDTLHSVMHSEGISFQPERIYAAGPGSTHPWVIQELQKAMGIECEPLDLLQSGAVIKDKSPAFDPSILQGAVASALAAFGRFEEFNLREGAFAKEGGLKRGVFEPIVWACVIAAFFFLKVWADYDFLKKKSELLKTAMTQLYLETFPGSMKVLDPLRQMKVAVNEALKGKGAEGQGHHGTLVDILMDISRRIPPSIDMRITRFSLDQEGIRLSARTDSFNTVDDIKSRLDASDYYTGVTISSANADQGGRGVQFEMLLKRGAR